MCLWSCRAKITEKTSDVGGQSLGEAVEDEGIKVEVFVNILSRDFDTFEFHNHVFTGSWKWASGRF